MSKLGRQTESVHTLIARIGILLTVVVTLPVALGCSSMDDLKKVPQIWPNK